MFRPVIRTCLSLLLLGAFSTTAHPSNVTLHARADPSLDGASWIWTSDTNFEPTAPAGSRAFRKTFNTPSGQTASTADVVITVDNSFTLYVNGKRIGSAVNWYEAASFHITNLNPTRNVFAILATNFVSEQDASLGSAAGVLLNAQITMTSGTVSSFGSDTSWRASMTDFAGFEQPSTSEGDSRWGAPVFLGKYGVTPWFTQVSVRAGSTVQLDSPITTTAVSVITTTTTGGNTVITTSQNTATTPTTAITTSSPTSPSVSGSSNTLTSTTSNTSTGTGTNANTSTNTGTVTTSSQTSSSTSLTPPTTDGNQNSNSGSNSITSGASTKKAPIGAIVGGVVGGIGLIAIIALVLFCIRRRRKKAEYDGTQLHTTPFVDTRQHQTQAGGYSDAAFVHGGNAGAYPLVAQHQQQNWQTQSPFSDPSHTSGHSHINVLSHASSATAMTHSRDNSASQQSGYTDAVGGGSSSRSGSGSRPLGGMIPSSKEREAMQDSSSQTRLLPERRPTRTSLTGSDSAYTAYTAAPAYDAPAYTASS